MFLRILKKDMKRKKTMNFILLIFVVLAVSFMASSANNLITVSTALDQYFEKAGVPDYWFATTNALDLARFEEFAEENGYDYHISQLIQIEPKNVFVEGKKIDYSSTLALSKLGGIKIFDKNNEEITHINDGEIYVPNFIFVSPENDFREGGKIWISQDGTEKEFTIRGYTKDALFGTEMVGMTRFLISEKDAAMFGGEGASVCSAVGVYTEDSDYRNHFNELGINTIMSIERPMFKMIYIMDGVYRGVPKLDVERLSEIRKVVSIPLVLHGTSGVPDDAVRECIRRGICKVNYATDLRIAFSNGVKEVLGTDPEVIDPKKYNARGRQYVKDYVMDKMKVCGSVGKVK